MAFDLWEVIAPAVVKDLHESDDDSKVLISEYKTEVTSKEVTLQDVKTVLFAILKFNDGKRFVEASKAPLP